MSFNREISSNPNKACQKSFHWRNDSGELDVFEAAQYFSGANEISPIGEDSPRVQTVARMSLDMPVTRNPFRADIDLVMDQKQSRKENKKYKQPSSPGARLASFLNSLFNQTTSKKKKSKSGSSSTKDLGEDQSPGGRRKRISGISHFRSKSNTASVVNTPTKSSKEFRNLSDHQMLQVSVPKNGAWKLEEEFRFSNGNVNFKNGRFELSERNSSTDWAADEVREFRKFSDVDDGADTDSSSDLFDLPNHDLGIYSNGLPVYGTTQMDKIRIVAPISSAATV